MGQVEECIALTVTVQLLWNGFVFETFMRSWAEEVERVRLAIQSVWSGVKEWGDGEQSSLACKKP